MERYFTFIWDNISIASLKKFKELEPALREGIKLSKWIKKDRDLFIDSIVMTTTKTYVEEEILVKLLDGSLEKVEHNLL